MGGAEHKEGEVWVCMCACAYKGQQTANTHRKLSSLSLTLTLTHLKKLKNESQGLFCVTTTAGAPFLPLLFFFTCSTAVVSVCVCAHKEQGRHVSSWA